MPNEPPVFAKQMNRWCIAMTHSRRRRDAKRARKGVLRQMKRLLRTIGEHARRHRDHLAADSPGPASVSARPPASLRASTPCSSNCRPRSNRPTNASSARDSAQRREDPLRLRTRRADRGPRQGVRRGRVWQHPHDQ
ncbi:MAG: hypothetical protein J6386_21910 [Candidatus Synoicihabitans palmerolidicus]|nr:hypothetical protein [Candidatus Synoicihabitans palmerolidicus]